MILKNGDLVQLRGQAADSLGSHVGVIIDHLENDYGFFHYKVLFPNFTEWILDLHLRLINEGG